MFPPFPHLLSLLFFFMFLSSLLPSSCSLPPSFLVLFPPFPLFLILVSLFPPVFFFLPCFLLYSLCPSLLSSLPPSLLSPPSLTYFLPTPSTPLLFLCPSSCMFSDPSFHVLPLLLYISLIAFNLPSLRFFLLYSSPLPPPRTQS